MKTRIMETTLQYVRDVMSGRFKNVKEMMADTIKKKVGNWFWTVNSYLEELGITWEEL